MLCGYACYINIWHLNGLPKLFLATGIGQTMFEDDHIIVSSNIGLSYMSCTTNFTSCGLADRPVWPWVFLERSMTWVHVGSGYESTWVRVGKVWVGMGMKVHPTKLADDGFRADDSEVTW